MAISDKRKARWIAQWREPGHEDSIARRVLDEKANPLAYSQLPYWLSLDLWGTQEGLEVLAGIEPGTVRSGLSGSQWMAGQPFLEDASFTMVDPSEACERDEFAGSDSAYQSFLEAYEHKRDVLAHHQLLFDGLLHRLERTADGLGEEAAFFKYRPIQFLAWARSIGFVPSWLAWAEANNRCPVEVEVMAAPFFDADAADYPELLHIAVRAWEHARGLSDGTPKQRVHAFLAARYPAMPQGSRDAVAKVVNWHRGGGRPTGRAKTKG